MVATDATVRLNDVRQYNGPFDICGSQRRGAAVGDVANADHSAGRAGLPASLRPLAVALDRACTVEEAADALVHLGLPALNACVGVLALLNEDAQEYFCPRISGYPQEVAEAWRRFPADAPVPIVAAVRQGQPILLESLERRKAFYPSSIQLPAQVGRALAAIPLKRGELVGALGLTFPDDRAFSDDEREILLLVAALCEETLARVRRFGIGCGVLLVDDEPGVLGMLDFALRMHAFTVYSAKDGEAGVRAFRRHQATVDVILLDVQMPRMDGPQTLTAIRQIDPEVPCVFMSGNAGHYTGENLAGAWRRPRAAEAIFEPG
jgi:CheY-like chemotaxis protein